MFHTSHQLNRESILANGLDPRLGVSPWYSPEDPIEYPIGVYLWFTLEEAIRYGQGNGDPFDVWKVTIAETEMMPDPITKGATYVSRVEASSVKLVYSSI